LMLDHQAMENAKNSLCLLVPRSPSSRREKELCPFCHKMAEPCWGHGPPASLNFLKEPIFNRAQIVQHDRSTGSSTQCKPQVSARPSYSAAFCIRERRVAESEPQRVTSKPAGRRVLDVRTSTSS
jgi:hypothetical protein